MMKRLLTRVGVACIAATAFAPCAVSQGPELVPAWHDHIVWEDDGPAAREHASVMRFGDRVVVLGGSGYEPQGSPLGDAWAFDTRDASWTLLTVVGEDFSAAGSRRVAQAPGSDRAWLFGGYGENFATNNELFEVTLDGETLTAVRVEQVDAPPARALHAFAFDRVAGVLIVSHGVSQQGFLDDTWIGRFDADGGVSWVPIGDGDHPGPRFGFSYGFDSDRGELIITSGQTPGVEGNPMAMTDETWVLGCRGDDPSWQRVEIEQPPAGRRNPMFAYDDAEDRLIVWCGTADARSNIPGLVALTRTARGSWRAESFDDDGAPARRSSGVGFVDPRSGRVYLGFGNSQAGQYTDWVTLSLKRVGDYRE